MERFISELKNHPRFPGGLLSHELLKIWDCTSTNKTRDECEAYREKWLFEARHSPAPVPARISLPVLECIHLGDKLPNQPCGGMNHHCTLLKDVICSRIGTCLDAQTNYHQCQHYTTSRGSLLWKFDETTLHPHYPGKRFNPSLIEYGDGYLMAWRSGWAGSDIYLSRLDWQFQAIRGQPVRLNLHHSEATWGREDPRLFWFRGQLHLSFIGVMPNPNSSDFGYTNVLYASLTDQLKVEKIYYPKIENRNSWEKNHAYFEHDGQLYAVYGYSPHRILRIDGEDTQWVHSTHSPGWKVNGEIRGGASPVFYAGEYWHWFHSRIENPRRYCLGLYTFAAKPPFEVKRICPQAIHWADSATKPPDQYCAAYFPCGALKQGSRWLISAGVHDRWGEVWEFEHSEMEKLLK
jgi:predicted GH43/DUF377 family glycosyl hydrolase